MRDALVAAAAVALFAAIEGIFHALAYVADRRGAELRRRLQAVGKTAALDSELLRRGRLARSAWAAALMSPVPFARRLERLLEQADSSWTVAHLILMSIAGLAAGVLLPVALRANVLAVAGLGALGALAPLASVLAARAQRARRLSEQLPEALDMMSRSLRAGHAITSAFQVVASEMPEPASIEFARAYEEQRLGLTLERAVLQMAERTPGNSDVKIFAVSAVVQRETGGNLAEILENIAETIRQRYRFYGKLRSLTAEGRASAAVLGALPFVVALALSVMNPGYLATLPGTPIGQWIIAFAFASWAVGLFWLYRMTQADV